MTKKKQRNFEGADQESLDLLKKMEEKTYTLDDMKKAFEAGQKISYDAFDEGQWMFCNEDFETWINQKFLLSL